MSLDIYVDESCQNAHDFMVLGGAIIHRDRVSEVANRLLELRGGSSKPLKWTNIKSHKVNDYLATIDYIVEKMDQSHLHFHCLIVDNRKIDNHLYNAGDKETGFNKFVGQFVINKFGRHYPSPLYLYMDSRETPQDTSELRDIYNNQLAARWNVDTAPFKRVMFRKYSSTPCLWISDILIGAAAYFKNGRHQRAGASQAKLDVGNHVLRRLGVTDEWTDRGYGTCKLSVWNFDFGKSRKGS